MKRLPDAIPAKFISILLLAYFTTALPLYGVQNSTGAHDPSSIVKDGDRYWIFTTGNGIYSAYSYDLISWTPGVTPYTTEAYPVWINGYVPGFEGHFWAPECIYMNGLYYLYYACSTWGSKISCIGLATSPSLNNPEWTDQGVVVYSTDSDDYNCIDPDIFFDADSNLWMTYGSWNTGIKMQQLDKVSGKPLNADQYDVGEFFDAENSQVVRHGSYYYLFLNRGLCCQGSSSTYYIQVGRSTEPTGPYTDWRTVLRSSGNFIGPGAIGYFREDTVEWATYHYYNSDASGSATLAVGRFEWEADWPVITLDWLENGTYKIFNKNSDMAWTTLSCSGSEGVLIVQEPYSGEYCQKWYLTQTGNGYYSIKTIWGGLPADINNCSSTGNEELLLANTVCQTFKVERTNDGDYVISAKAGNLVIEVKNNSTSEGAVLRTWLYSGGDSQKWYFESDTTSITAMPENLTEKTHVTIYPNPAKDHFTVVLPRIPEAGKDIELKVITLTGKVIFTGTYEYSDEIQMNIPLDAGVYMISVDNKIVPQKLVVLE